MFGCPLLLVEAKETAGGILLALSKDDADDLIDALDKKKVGHWEIGNVIKGNGKVQVVKDAKLIEV